VIKEFRELRDILKEKMLKRRKLVSKRGAINIKYKESGILKNQDSIKVLYKHKLAKMTQLANV